MKDIVNNTKLKVCLKHLQDDGDISNVYIDKSTEDYPVFYIKAGNVSNYNKDVFYSKKDLLLATVDAIILLVIGPGIMFKVRDIDTCKNTDKLEEVNLCQKK